MPDQSPRRSLSFQSLDEVARDVRTLQTHGYESVGKWDLAQVCRHLNDWMRFPVEGFPHASFPKRMAFLFMRIIIGRSLLRKILANGTMDTGVPTLPATVHEPENDDSDAVERLCATIDRLESHEGPFHASPLFGDLDRETLVRLQLIHCAHHLSFLRPKV